jgi:cell division protein FtsI (penicillin-binding protein 3)
MSQRTPPTRPMRKAAPKVRRSPSARPVRKAAPSVRRSVPQKRTLAVRPETQAPSRHHRGATRTKPKRRVVVPLRPNRVRGTTRTSSPAFRLRLLLVLLLVVLGAVLFKVAKLQSTGGEALRAAGADQWTRTTPLSADRGAIFDRNGEELAMSVPASSISVNPKLVTDEVGTARFLQSMLSLSDSETRELYNDLVVKERGFVYVRREVDPTIGDQISALNLTGVNVDSEDKRVLPGGDTGRSVIGRTDIDGVGTAGLELQFDELLTGVPGQLSKEVAPGGRSIAGTEQVSLLPVPGNDIILTLDRSIQFATERALLERVTELGARSGTVVVMDTDTGDLFAMASVRRNDDDVVEITSGNFAAVDAYEPGSVAKVITIAAGLNQGAVKSDSTFVVPWRRQYADDLLKDSHEHPDELMTVEEILVESSNIGTIDVQQATGREVHWEYMRRFGLGEQTALAFPGESPGILKHWSELFGSERVTVAYGQGVASTSVQLAAAVNVIANGGNYVEPRLVDAIVGRDGEITRTEPSVTREVVRPEVAVEVQRMMRQVVCRGTATRAQLGIENFSVAGKTGTGFKAQPNGTYLNEKGEFVYYASFVGFFPAENPQVTVLVSIDEPPAGDINRFGGTAAAPVFAELAPAIVHELGIQPPPDAAPCAAS